MKKFLLLCLSIACLCNVFAHCGGGGNATDTFGANGSECSVGPANGDNFSAGLYCVGWGNNRSHNRDPYLYNMSLMNGAASEHGLTITNTLACPGTNLECANGRDWIPISTGSTHVTVGSSSSGGGGGGGPVVTPPPSV